MSTNVVALKTGGQIGGIIPQTIEEVFRLATAVAKSGLAPHGMNTAEKLSVAIMHGMEIGLPPMQAIQRIAVVNGRPTVWGDAIPALLQSKGFKVRERMAGQGENLTAYCEVVRPDGEVIERMFSVQDAKTAGLWGKAGPWKQYPSRMLQMRARGYAARDGAADALAGLYLREEIEDEEATAPKSAYRARKDGDFEKLTSALAACASDAEIDALLANMSETLDKIPRKWHEHIDEHVEAARKRVSAVTIEPVADEQAAEEITDDMAACKQDIQNAVNLAHLRHLQEVYGEEIIQTLSVEYDAKYEALSAAAE
jgi:hypothetical protein